MRMRACLRPCVRACVHACKYMRTYVSTCVYVRDGVHACVYVPVCTCVYENVCVPGLNQQAPDVEEKTLSEVTSLLLNKRNNRGNRHGTIVKTTTENIMVTPRSNETQVANDYLAATTVAMEGDQKC
jgi:hypothetical protein